MNHCCSALCCCVENLMSPWEVILVLSLSRWLAAPESKWWEVQKRQIGSLPLNPSDLASDQLALSALRWLWSAQQPCGYCPSSHKRGYGTAAREGRGALATRKSFVYFQVGFLLMPSVPRGPLRQPQPDYEVAEHTRSRRPRSGGGEACCRQWRMDRSHVVLHSPPP